MRSSLPGGAAPAAAQYKRPTELLADLSLLESSLDAVGARRLGRADVAPVRRLVEAFGFHLAAVDVRQNSAFHDKAIEQLLAASGAADTAFGTWSEEKRLEFLCGELASPRPLAHVSTPLGAEARAVVDALRVLAAHLDTHGAGGLGSLVVSMTRQLSDLLAVYLLSREAGVVRQVDGALVSLLPVVPLFETVDDLQRAPGLVTQVCQQELQLRLGQASLAHWQARVTLAHRRRVQQLLHLSTVHTRDRSLFGLAPVRQSIQGDAHRAHFVTRHCPSDKQLYSPRGRGDLQSWRQRRCCGLAQL